MKKILALLLISVLPLGCTVKRYPPLDPLQPGPGPVVVDPTPGPGPVQPTPGPVIPDPTGTPIPSTKFDAFAEGTTTMAETEAVVGKGNHPDRKQRLDPRSGITYRFFLVLCPSGVKDAVLEFRNGVLTHKDVCF